MKITTLPTSPTTERVTQNQIINRFLRETESGGYGTVTAAGTTAASFYDTTSLKSGQYTEDDLEKCWIRISGHTADAAPYGEIRAVAEYDPVLGRVVVAPPFSVPLTAGDTYQFFRWPHPKKLLDHIDTILTEETWLPTMGICTEVPDGDMELSTSADWASSAATIVKGTAEPLGGGRRYLKVTDGGAGGGYAVSTNPIYVEEDETFHLSALARVDGTATATLAVWNETAGTLIDSITIGRNQWVRPYIDLETPVGCRSIKLRLITDTAGGIAYWDDICLFAVAEQSMGLPNYIENKDQITNEINQNNVWSADAQMRSENGWDFYEDGFTGHNRLRTRVTHSNMPLLIYAMRKEEAYSTTDSSDHRAISSNWMHFELCTKVFESMSSWPGAGALDSKWIDRKLKEYEIKRNQERYKNAMRLDKIFQAPSEIKYVG